MESNQILYPLIAQALLTILVQIYMYYERLGELYRKKANIEKLSNAEYESSVLVESVHSSDNFENLFEMPVLFYVAVFTVLTLKAADQIYVALSWAFVVLRAAHSVIHCSYNRIHHRFVVYILSSITIWIFWGRIVFQVF